MKILKLNFMFSLESYIKIWSLGPHDLVFFVSFQKLLCRFRNFNVGNWNREDRTTKGLGGRWSVDEDVESVKNHPENVRYFWLCGNDDRRDTGEWHQPKGDSLWLASLSMIFQIPPIISSPKSQFLQIKLLLPFPCNDDSQCQTNGMKNISVSDLPSSRGCVKVVIAARIRIDEWMFRGAELEVRHRTEPKIFFFTILPVSEKGITEKTISWGIPGFNVVQAHNPMSN